MSICRFKLKYPNKAVKYPNRTITFCIHYISQAENKMYGSTQRNKYNNISVSDKEKINSLFYNLLYVGAVQD